MEGETLETFYTQLVLMPKVLNYAQHVLLALGCVLLLIPIIYQIRSQVSSGQSMAWAEWSLACLLGGRRGSNQIPNCPFLLCAWTQPAPSACTHFSRSSPRSLLGLGSHPSLHPCLSCTFCAHFSACPGRLGGPTFEELQWFWIMRPGTRMVCSAVPAAAGCQVLAGTMHTTVNKTVPADGHAGTSILVGKTGGSRVTKQKR